METVVVVLMILVSFKANLLQAVDCRCDSRVSLFVCRTDVAACHRAVENPDCRLVI